jgi:GH35 family endo-1,4-beta-xylanase
MNHYLKKTILASVAGLFTITSSAQLSTNPDKFLGNITTGYGSDMDTNGRIFHDFWNQVTPENASKWGSVEGTRNNYNWGGADKAFNYAKKWDFTYKFHALIWGSQYPDWLPNLSPKDRFAAMVKWFDAVKKKYNHLPMIDVVNEAVGTHQPGNPMIKESLGGGGKTGYDWLIKAYEMAFERFPNSILIYNDFNTFQWNTDEYIDLVRTLRDAGAPIDAYGCQSHDVGDISETNLKNVLKKLQDGLKMPMYITELDISKENDAQQKAQYQKVFPLMWESPYCAGVTLWGWIYGQTWDQAKYSGLIKNGKERSALTWIKDYMASDVAKNAKSPYPGMKKRLSVFVKPLALKVAKGDVLPIKVRTYITDAAKEEKADYAIDKVELYDGNDLIATMTEEPYIAEYTASTAGTKTLKAIVYTNDGNTHERYSRVTVLSSTTKREPYNETIPELPGTINMIEYDKGESGVSYNKFSRSATAVTQNDGWAEYTVDVKEDGIYSFDAEVASTKTGGAFHISEYTLDNLNFLSEFIEVPKTGSASDFQTIHGLLQAPLTAGRHVLCLNIEKGGFYIKNLTFSRYEEDKTMTCTVSRTPTTITIGDKATITVTAKSNTSTIANVKIYANNLLISTLTEPTSDSNYVFEYEPTTAGSQVIKAIITDAEGKSKTSSNVTLTVNTKREPYSSMTIPGTIQAENYDKGGANKAYKDNETENRGDANFRTDEGVDIVKGNGGRALGYTAKGEWVEYTIDVKQAGTYDYTATVSSGTTGSGFSINVNKNGSITKLADISVPQTGNNSWDTYKTMKGTLSKSLEAGQQIIRIVITGDNCNIDMIQFTANETGINSVTIDESSEEALYNLSGQKVDANYRGIIIQNGKKRLNK